LSDEAGKLATGQEVQPVLVTSRPRRGRREPRDLTDGELAGWVYRQARCAGSPVDPDDWFPVTHDVAKAYRADVPGRRDDPDDQGRLEDDHDEQRAVDRPG